MIFNPLDLEGAYLIEPEPRIDGRGSFARAFCAREFVEAGLESEYVQMNLSTNHRAGTVRGMHYQRGNHAEVKLVRCVQGTIYDVIVDLREGSPTFRRWVGAELSEKNGSMMYVPRGFAHGYQSLTAGATALYMVSAYYEPASEAGCRHDDPALEISWPLPISDVSEKDNSWPLLDS